MKNILLLLVFSNSLLTYSQVGIGTRTPQKTLDINGDLRVAATSDKGSDPQYDKVLVANADGTVGAWQKDNVKEQIASTLMENKKVVVFSNAPDINRTMECGRFEFRFNVGPVPQVKLSTNPAQQTVVYYSRIHRENSGASSFYGNNTFSSNQPLTFETSNDWQSLDDSSNITDTLNEIYISYPGDNNLYRLTLLPRTMQTSPTTVYFYTMMCEKF
ncbi:hypothetical protein [Chryseobacterium sp. FH1]|uniref:hypothetical protein n=1 Tax=Chryseobacterium sp. FH1 TaxID=1233951 RepID=UPI0004E2B8BF|nr:hypothetical protein [Chryseobacterium sp. FH1]KFC19657.1 hypothetical protein IO90_10310 [Chryseobacterium sp. FH1]